MCDVDNGPTPLNYSGVITLILIGSGVHSGIILTQVTSDESIYFFTVVGG